MPHLINGTVKNGQGETIPMANIFLSDKDGNITGNSGTTSDVNGNFSFVVPDSGFVTASYTGFGKQTIPITNPMALVPAKYDFVLGQNSTLKEVIVIAKRTPWLWIILAGFILGIIIYLIVK